MDRYEITKDLLCEDIIPPSEQTDSLASRRKEREKHYAAGGAIGPIMAGSTVVGAGIALGAGAPFLIGAALGTAAVSGVYAGLAYLYARATRAGYSPRQMRKMARIYKKRAIAKGLKESKLMTENIMDSLLDGYRGGILEE